MILEKIKNYLSPKETLKRKLTPEQFIDYERMVKESGGIMSWEKLEKCSKFNDDKSLEWIYWEGNLNLLWIRTRSLKYLKKVWGIFSMFASGIESLENLREVWWDLDLRSTSIRNLPKLEEVWMSLNLELSIIKNLPKLEYVWWNLNLQWTSIKSLPKLKYIWYSLHLSWIPENNLKNILKELNKNSTKVWWKITYGLIDFKDYIRWKSFLNYLENFENENMDEELLNNHKKKFIDRYWTWRVKRDDKVKRELNTLANIFYYQFVENFLIYRDKIKLMQKNWASKEEIDEKVREIYKKLDDKFEQIEYYFWEEIKNRLLDEFRKEMKEKLTKKEAKT